MTEVEQTLEHWVAGLSEMRDDDLANLLHLLERTYIHTLIERGLRGASR